MRERGSCSQLETLVFPACALALPVWDLSVIHPAPAASAEGASTRSNLQLVDDAHP